MWVYQLIYHVSFYLNHHSQETLAKIDVFARDLHHSLLSRNLSQIVDVIFVSDHGMGDTSEVEWIYLDGDDILGTFLLRRSFRLLDELKFTDSLTAQVTHGIMLRTTMAGRPLDSASRKKQTNELFWRTSFAHPTNRNSVASSKCTPQNHMLAVCICVIIARNLRKMNYPCIGPLEEATPMPPRYHFASNERIAPIWVVPTLGYALTCKTLGENGMSIGVRYFPCCQSVH